MDSINVLELPGKTKGLFEINGHKFRARLVIIVDVLSTQMDNVLSIPLPRAE